MYAGAHPSSLPPSPLIQDNICRMANINPTFQTMTFTGTQTPTRSNIIQFGLQNIIFIELIPCLVHLKCANISLSQSRGGINLYRRQKSNTHTKRVNSLRLFHLVKNVACLCLNRWGSKHSKAFKVRCSCTIIH